MVSILIFTFYFINPFARKYYRFPNSLDLVLLIIGHKTELKKFNHSTSDQSSLSALRSYGFLPTHRTHSKDTHAQALGTHVLVMELGSYVV